VKLQIICTFTECFLGGQLMKAGVGGTYGKGYEMTVGYFVL
jgi:hypothetical protein